MQTALNALNSGLSSKLTEGLQKRGRDAFGVVAGLQAWHDTTFEQATSGLNEDQKAQVQARFLPSFTSAMRNMSRHQFEQQDAVEVDAHATAISNTADHAALGDVTDVGLIMDSMRKSSTDFYMARGVEGKALAGKIKDNESAIISSAVDAALAADDVGRAKDLLDAYRGRIHVGAVAAINKDITGKRRALERQAEHEKLLARQAQVDADNTRHNGAVTALAQALIAMPDRVFSAGELADMNFTPTEVLKRLEVQTARLNAQKDNAAAQFVLSIRLSDPEHVFTLAEFKDRGFDPTKFSRLFLSQQAQQQTREQAAAEAKQSREQAQAAEEERQKLLQRVEDYDRANDPSGSQGLTILDRLHTWPDRRGKSVHAINHLEDVMNGKLSGGKADVVQAPVSVQRFATKLYDTAYNAIVKANTKGTFRFDYTDDTKAAIIASAEAQRLYNFVISQGKQGKDPKDILDAVYRQPSWKGLFDGETLKDIMNAGGFTLPSTTDRIDLPTALDLGRGLKLSPEEAAALRGAGIGVENR